MDGGAACRSRLDSHATGTWTLLVRYAFLVVQTRLITSTQREHYITMNNDQKLQPTADERIMQADQKFHYFWKAGNPFSQWHSSVYDLDGIQFCCAEQGFQGHANSRANLDNNQPKEDEIFGTKGSRLFRKRVEETSCRNRIPQ